MSFHVVLSYVGRGFAMGPVYIQGVLPNVWKDSYCQKLILNWIRLEGLICDSWCSHFLFLFPWWGKGIHFWDGSTHEADVFKVTQNQMDNIEYCVETRIRQKWSGLDRVKHCVHLSQSVSSFRFLLLALRRSCIRQLCYIWFVIGFIKSSVYNALILQAVCICLVPTCYTRTWFKLSQV